MAVLERIEIWSDVECNSGARTGIIPRHAIVSASEYLEVSGREELSLSLDPEHPSVALIDHDDILRTVYDDDSWDEYRVRILGRNRSPTNQTQRTVLARSIKFDLQTNVPLVAFTEKNGRQLLHHELGMIGPEDYLDALIARLDFPGYFTKGTVDPISTLTFVLDWETYLSAIDELATVTDSELVVRRNGTTDYKIDILTELNATAETPLIVFKKNVLSEDVTEDSTEMGTLIYGKGEGSQGESPGLDDARWYAWPLQATNPPWEYSLVLWGGDSFGSIRTWPAASTEADQFNGMYYEWFDYTSGTFKRAEITDSQPNTTFTNDENAIDVILDTATSGVPSTFLGWIRSDAAGTSLPYIPVPSAQALYGDRPYIVERLDIPGVYNVLDDAFCDYGIAGSSDYTAISGATISDQNAPSEFVKYGSNAIRVQCPTAGDGMEKESPPAYRFGPTPESPHFSWQVMVYLISGKVKFQIVHSSLTTPITYPNGVDTEGNPVQHNTEAVETWYHLTIEPSLVNFYDQDPSTMQVDMQLIAVEDNTEFYVDAYQCVNQIYVADKITLGVSAAHLWGACIAAIPEATSPKVTLDISVLDVHRLDQATYQYDEILPGVTLLIRDPGLSVDLEERVFSLKRDLLREALTTVELF